MGKGGILSFDDCAVSGTKHHSVQAELYHFPRCPTTGLGLHCHNANVCLIDLCDEESGTASQLRQAVLPTFRSAAPANRLSDCSGLRFGGSHARRVGTALYNHACSDTR